MKIPTFVKITGWAIFIITLFCFFYALFGEDIKERHQLNKELSEKQKENEKLQAEIDEIREKLAKLDNPEYLEYLARQRGLVYQDEVVIIYKKEEEEK